MATKPAMTTVIRAENLGKKYLIRHEQQGRRFRYDSLSESLVNGGKAVCQRLLHPFSSRPKAATQEEFWALKDINFEIEQGDRVGIIGRNGAGKSTLLKILSRITKPTTGQVKIKGRVASLLEVGTGFHPELTGRENIYLNGAILGMRRKEIARKFDEIVAFAEVDTFLDTPVKHYSSGMYVRLAFAVAAHLEPEILVIDEVLSVGDVHFQKKCLGKMESIGKSEGKTILFVSHNMQTVRQLCSRAISIEKGIIEFDGSPHEGIALYIEKGRISTIDFSDKFSGAFISKVRFLNSLMQENSRFSQNERLTVEVYITLLKAYKKLNVSMALLHGEFGAIFSESLADYSELVKRVKGNYALCFSFDLSYLKLEQYYLTIHLVDIETGEGASHVSNIPLPEIYNDNADNLLESARWGIIRFPVTWSNIKSANNQL